MTKDLKTRIKELTELGELRHAEQGKTGIVHLKEYLTPEESRELLDLLRTIPSKKKSNENMTTSVEL